MHVRGAWRVGVAFRGANCSVDYQLLLSLSYHVNLIRSTIAVAKQRGVENPATLAHYYRDDWKLYRDEL